MANWDNITERGEVNDLRGSTFSTVAGVGGIGTIVAFAIVLMGGNSDVAKIVGNVVDNYVPAVQNKVGVKNEFVDPTNYQDFASKIVGSVDKVYTDQFQKAGKNYKKSNLILFRSFAPSACGGAYSEHGPHYCPADKRVYLDETFFKELNTRYGASQSKVAQAYVIAHEIGHHVQNQLGILNSQNNAESIKVELQADCLAGVWTGFVQNAGIIEKHEFKDAVSAAAAIGDDHIQHVAGQKINPENWTHGSSKDRVEALETGFNSKNMQTCLAKYRF